MARTQAPPEPKEDVPAWFMTYSDVITLLMTFFILLLTFSTTEPERFEKVQKAIFANGAANGIAGAEMEGPENDSFVQRVRPRASRIAIKGSEMAPYLTDTSKQSVGKGLKTLTEQEAQQDVMKTHSFEISIDELVDANGVLTSRGTYIAKMFSSELRKLPVNLSLDISNEDFIDRATKFISFMIDSEKIRPGQVGVGLVESLSSQNVQFSLERFEVN